MKEPIAYLVTIEVIDTENNDSSKQMHVFNTEDLIQYISATKGFGINVLILNQYPLYTVSELDEAYSCI